MRTFRSLRHRDYRLYFVGQLVSLIGSWTQVTALMWLAHEQTQQAKWPAFLVAAQIGPTLLLGAFGGALADRMPMRRLIARTQVGFLGCAASLLLLYYTGWLTVPAMLAVMFAHGVIQAIDLPARLAFVPSLVDRDDLINAVALNSLLFNAARAVGPAVAGILLAWGGPGACFVVNAVSYLAILAAIALIRARPAVPDTPQRVRGGGFGVLAKQPGMLVLVILAGAAAVGGWPLMALLPSFADSVLGAGQAGYSFLLSAVGVGALVAALTAATFGTEARRKPFLLGGLLLTAAALAGLTAARTIWPAAGCCAVFGYGMILFFATGQSAVQLGTVDANRGKVMGVWAMVLSAGVPVGNLVFGPAADAFGLTAVLCVQTAILAAAAGGLLRYRF